MENFFIDRQNNIPISLAGGGEMGERIRALNWADSSLGPIHEWPKTLQSALSICINSNFPIAIYWGNDLVLLYNDPWSPIPGNKHPWALGRPAKEVWPDIWPDIEPQFQKAFGGIPGGSKDALLPMQRHGYIEECYFDFTFTPIYGETGAVEGVFNAVIETTYRYINERRSFILQRLANAINSITSGVIEKAGEILEKSKVDIPFYGIYRISNNDHIELQKQSPDFPQIVNQFTVTEILNKGTSHLLTDLEKFASTNQAYWPEITREAFFIPFTGNDGKVFGFIILGISPRRKFDKDYQSFCESIATIINGELNTIQALEEERRRSEALAEIDRAKTTFFSNISHEFRTPLTLMLSPLEVVLETGENLTDEQKSYIEASYRNTLRLQKLVNALLYFSRLESGRTEINFEEVEIGKLTEDLSSSFRSAIEKAGLNFNVSIGRIISPAYVDVDMWEKIVLNLISNALKYTQHGEIGVSINHVNDQFEFIVSDTGLGISQEDQGKIFDRFYRVNNSEGRSQEGTGIGLSLVKELIKLHDGNIRIESALGKGSKFIVNLPAGKRQAHQDKKQKKTFETSRRAYVEEANTWVVENTNHTRNDKIFIPESSAFELKPKVLIADDNSDMRMYLNRLLQHNFQVESTVNGEEAFRVALDWKPDLIVSDIMMPKLDGFGLLKKLKNNLSTRNIPVIFLSARAGEEATVEGIESGADDYLTKPFSSKELLARVSNHIAISNTRRKTEKEFYNLFLQSPAHIHVMKGPEHVLEFFHPLGIPFAGRDVTGMKVRDALPQVEGQGFFEILDKVYNEGTAVSLKEAKALFPDSDGQFVEHYFNTTYLPWKDLQGNVQGVLQFTFEVTETVKERLKAEANERNFRAITEQSPVAICVLKSPDHIIQTVNDPLLRIWGRKHEDVINRTIAEALPEVVDQGIIQLLNEVYETGKPYSASEWAVELMRNGKSEKIYLNLIFQPFVSPEQKIDGIITIAIDVSEQVRSREVIEESKYYLNNAVDLAELGTWNIDLKNNFVDYSPRVAEWWGLSVNGANLDIVIDCIHADDREKVLHAVNHAINTSGYYDADYRLINAITKQERYIQANGKVFYDDNGPVRLSGTARDVSLFKMTQHELERQVNARTQELIDLNRDLSTSNENLRQFAYVASHDLQEPLRKIQTFSAMVKDQMTNQNFVRTYLSKIDSSAARMSALIRDVLLYSKISKDERNEVLVDLNQVLEDVKNDFELLIEQKDAVIRAVPLPVIKGNPLHFRQLFSNLIGNSLKFSETSPFIEIHGDLKDGKDTPLPLNKSKKYHRLEFRDNGIGFEPEYADQIFGLFTRLHNGRDFGGTGIGLALCKKVVESYDGLITATSRKGEGTTFVILLPTEKTE